MQPYKNGLPLDEPQEISENAEKMKKQISDALKEADEVRIFKSQEAQKRKKMFREWRRQMKRK